MDADRLTPALADRYRIEAEIDTGGMATVYRARDLKHDRTVAIKVLRPDLAEAIGADRFLREIRTTANLSQPHILPLHDSGEAGGFLYYVMPFVEGESLRDRLEREGQLPVDDAVQIAREVADALAYAHDKGVIHRDIKPANILLERGHALLADFGIAQAKAGVEETKLTGSGMSLGTPSYMSPEQIAGNREVDGRSDQYALACVLYETLAGHPPFTGSDIQTVMRQHLAAEAPKVTGARTAVPMGVAKAIHRAMAKTPADRFRNMEELEKALAGATLPLLARIPMSRARGAIYATAAVLVVAAAWIIGAGRWGSRGGGDADYGSWRLDSQMVAVFPLKNLTGDSSKDDWGRSAADWIIRGLNLSDEIQPEPLDNLLWALGPPGAEQDQRRTAAERGLGRLVTGEYLATGEDSVEFRVSIRRVSDGQDLYLLGVSGPVSDLASMIDSVGQRVAGALAADLDPDTDYYLRHAFNYRAYQAFWQGKEDFNSMRWAGAIKNYWEAYQLDTTFLTALMGVGMAARNDGLQEVVDSVASRLRPRLDELDRKERFWFEWMTSWDHVSRLNLIRTEMKREPDEHTRILQGMEALTLGYVWEAVGALEEVDPEDPLVQESWVYWRTLADAYHILGRYQEELELARRGREHIPDDTILLSDMLRALLGMGDFTRLDSLLAVVGGMENIPGRTSPGGVLLRAADWAEHHGYPERAIEIAERSLGWERRGQPEHSQNIVWCLLMANRPREGLELLDSLISEAPDDRWLHRLCGIALARTGQEAEAQEEADWLEALDGPDLRGQPTRWRAGIAAILGQKETAVQLLRQSLREGSVWWDLYPGWDLASLVGYEPFEEMRKVKDGPPTGPTLLERLKGILR
jgi:serine/threonine protein kinase/tetratricopeptide (TPR) repeat protein